MIKSPLLTCRAALMAAAVGLFAVAANGQTLLSHYTLDGNGNDGGTLGVNGTLAGNAFFTPSGTGAGKFDRALSTVDGTNDYFVADTVTGESAPFAMNSMTVALWVNLSSASNSQIERLVSNATASAGFDLTVANYNEAAGNFELRFNLNSTSAGSALSATKYATGQWLFIAVTYDGSNMRFYGGSEAASVVLNDTVAKTLSGGGGIVASTLDLEIGGTGASPNDRSPVALFNDVRIYDGALDATALEAIRQSAVIPEPSTYAMIFGVLALGFVAVRKRRHC